MSVTAALFRWNDLELDKVTEMVSRKTLVEGGQSLAQIYLKKGALGPRHRHHAAQWIYVLQGALAVTVSGQPAILVHEGEVLWVPPDIEHHTEAIEDTFLLDVRT